MNSLIMKNPNKVDFAKLFEQALPQEAKDLEETVKKFKDKDSSQYKDLGHMQMDKRAKFG